MAKRKPKTTTKTKPNGYTAEELEGLIVRPNSKRLYVVIYSAEDMPGIWLVDPDKASQPGIQLGTEWRAALDELRSSGKVIAAYIQHGGRGIQDSWAPA